MKRSIDQKLRLRNFDARHGRIESGAVVKNRKGTIGVEGGRGICYSGKKKASVRKDTDAVSATTPKIVHKKQNTLTPRILSQPFHEVEVCRGREVSEAKVTMVPFFDDRADVIWEVLARDRLVNIGIFPSVNAAKQKRDAKPGISVCSRIRRLMNNQTKSQRKATIPTEKRKWRHECCGYCENCTTIGLRLARLGSLSLRYVKRVSGKRKDHRWER